MLDCAHIADKSVYDSTLPRNVGMVLASKPFDRYMIFVLHTHNQHRYHIECDTFSVMCCMLQAITVLDALHREEHSLKHM